MRQSGIPRKYNDAPGTQRVGRSQKCAHVARILYGIENENGFARTDRQVGQLPCRRLYNRDDTLGSIGVGEIGQIVIVHLVDRHPGVSQVVEQGHASLRPAERRTDGGSFKGQLGS